MPSILDILTGAGAALDLPGSSIRDVLAGQNPVDQWYKSPFSFEDRTMGRGLLEQYGLLSPNQPGLDMGDVAGFGVDVATDPLGLLLGGGAGRAAHRGLLSGARRAAKTPSPGIFGAGELQQAFGRPVRQLSAEEATQAWTPWAKSLEAPEEDVLAWYSGSGSEGMNHLLRGKTVLPSGDEINPFAYGGGVRPPGYTRFPRDISTPEEIAEQVLPHMNTALAKGAAPTDMVTYRSTGPLEFGNVQDLRKLIGETIETPGATSTNISPHSSFYGRSPSRPSNVISDIILPKGAPGGYLPSGPMGRWAGENELLLPPGASYRVKDVKDVPLVNISPEPNLYRQWRYLDPEGKPMPSTNDDLRNFPNLFRPHEAYPQGLPNPRYPAGTFEATVDPRLLQPDWAKKIADMERASQQNVLLEMLLPTTPKEPSEIARLLQERYAF